MKYGTSGAAPAGLEQILVQQAWEAVAGGTPPNEARLSVTGPAGALPSALPVQETAVAAVGTALLAAETLRTARGARPGRWSLDRAHVAAAVTSERSFSSGGAGETASFAPLSRFWAAADGWVRTHANYPWHRAALLGVLGCDARPEAVAEAIAERSVIEIEDSVTAAGGVAAGVRSAHEWRDHPQGAAVAAEPLVACEVAGPAGPRRGSSGDGPAGGLRILDLTRVIAGPVCTRFLGALGADVLRLDPPARPDGLAGRPMDTLLAKRSASLDLGGVDGAQRLDALLREADGLVCGYRPGALDRFGLTPVALAERYPGLVVVYLSAWGYGGPWAQRRGFDSVVQAPTGLAAIEAEDPTGEPGALPCQLLDHGTGYLAAAALLDGLRRQREAGGTVIRRVSLARTAGWLASHEPQARAAPAGPVDASPYLVDVPSAAGPVRAVAPPGALDSRPLGWPAAGTYVTSAARWGRSDGEG